jgi:predicted O-linked N-acetylglucosamine transferase (SPINDLY family)
MKRLTALFDEAKWEELEGLSRSLIKADKKNGIAWKALATALEYQNKDPLPAMRKAVALLPNDPQAYFNLGNALKWHDKKHDAIMYYKRALELKPDYAEAWSNLGNTYAAEGEPYEALRCYWNGIKIAPQLVNIQLNMGNCYSSLGEHERALRMYNMSLDIAPDFLEAANAILFAKDLMSVQTVEGAQADRKTWSAKFADNLSRQRHHPNDTEPSRRLRIGYVSADFREHSAARSFGAIFVHHDRENFELFAYHTTRRPDDEYTKMFRENVDHWERITDTNDQDVAALVRRDKIDILVDLSGHSGGNRLLMFALKPAPIQVTGWGYATGTGMAAMDGLFADEITVPADERKFYAEEILYLPCIDCPYWVETFPEVTELPALAPDANGIITFGSLNRLAKVTEDTLKLWARVLVSVPNSAFVMKAGEFSEAKPRERITKRFGELGVAPERLILLGSSDWRGHMETYGKIDISLDTIPQGGGVTTLEGLMMGVPVVALRWPTIPGRVSCSIMTACGLPDWVAETQDEYVAKAVKKASDLKALGELRRVIRPMFQGTVGDGLAAARAVEARYRMLWLRWCAKQVHEKAVFDNQNALA